MYIVLEKRARFNQWKEMSLKYHLKIAIIFEYTVDIRYSGKATEFLCTWCFSWKRRPEALSAIDLFPPPQYPVWPLKQLRPRIWAHKTRSASFVGVNDGLAQLGDQKVHTTFYKSEIWNQRSS